MSFNFIFLLEEYQFYLLVGGVSILSFFGDLFEKCLKYKNLIMYLNKLKIILNKWSQLLIKDFPQLKFDNTLGW